MHPYRRFKKHVFKNDLENPLYFDAPHFIDMDLEIIYIDKL